ncbi:hypothetical protein Stsp01_62360 [Streptomyces sp. NBRC 13847]|uniref:hypothetical protein n=1 Tax=Streptomyces TaxID=1883 RepID=UPI0024A54BBB|nr:hypothetical protein [Streptomyces sp. NBRC 13847]GLW19493.1 hypothetical protein Stsp01_62360 [Streptomyces sp. NBRC 13847]
MDEATETTAEIPPVPPYPPTSTRRRPVIAVIVGTVIIAAISSGITAILVSGSDKEAAGPKPTSAKSAPATPSEDPTEASEETEETYNDSPTSTDFTLSMKTTKKQCFGSAGCDITVEPNVSYVSAISLDPEKTISITYEIHGDESGPVIQTLELSDGDQVTYNPVSIAIAGRSTKVTAEITDVTVSS